LWKTPDQQGAQAYQEGNYDVAAGAFENPDWKASALYKAGQYDAAAQTFETLQSPAASYNLGNALAYAGKLEAALEAYDKALEQQPGDADTQFNRDLVASLLEQQQQEQEQQKQDQDQQQQDQDQQNESGQGDSSSGEGKDQSTQDQQGEQGAQDQQASASQGGGKNGQNESPDNEQGEGQGQNEPGGEEQNLAQSGEGDSGETPSQGDRQPSGAAGENEPVTSPAQQQAAADGKNAFERAMDQVLQGNGSPQPTGTEPTENGEQASSGLSELDQAREQQLRAVPDDPSGLLRARIRQYYAQQYPYGGNS
jgi:Ca-activated chloride channel family protein